MAVDEPNPWLNVKEAKTWVRCGETCIYQAIKHGELKAVKVGLAYRIHTEWLDAWMKSRATVVNPDAPGPALAYYPRKKTG